MVPGAVSCLLLFIYTSTMAACISRLPLWSLPLSPLLSHPSYALLLNKEEEGTPSTTPLASSSFRPRLTKSAQAIAADQQKGPESPPLFGASVELGSCHLPFQDSCACPCPRIRITTISESFQSCPITDEEAIQEAHRQP